MFTSSSPSLETLTSSHNTLLELKTAFSKTRSLNFPFERAASILGAYYETASKFCYTKKEDVQVRPGSWPSRLSRNAVKLQGIITVSKDYVLAKLNTISWQRFENDKTVYWKISAISASLYSLRQSTAFLILDLQNKNQKKRKKRTQNKNSRSNYHFLTIVIHIE